MTAGQPDRRRGLQRRHRDRCRDRDRLAIALQSQSAGDPSFDPGLRHRRRSTFRPDATLGSMTPGVPESYAGVRPSPRPPGSGRGWSCTTADGWSHSRSGSLRWQPGTTRCRSCRSTRPGSASTAIASGQYDAYLRSYAAAVKAFGRQVIFSFGHEMNGYWYSWGYRHTSPAVFVAAWRHIVTVFRAAGAQNVTWLWTINIMHTPLPHPIPGPLVARQFIRELGGDRWLLLQAILEVRFPVRADHQGRACADPRPDTDFGDGRPPAARQPAKIADLFAGVRTYGLLGLCGSTSPSTRTGASAARRHPPRSAAAPAGIHGARL